MSEMGNILDKINSKLEMAEKMISNSNRNYKTSHWK